MAVHRPRARALAFRLDDAARARAASLRTRARSCSCIRTTPPERKLRRGQAVKVKTRRGEVVTRVETTGRNKPPRGRGVHPVLRRDASSSTS